MWMGATLSLSVDQWMDLWLIPTFWLLWTWVCRCLSQPLFSVFGEQTQGGNRWGIWSLCVSRCVYLATLGLNCGVQTLSYSMWALVP